MSIVPAYYHYWGKAQPNPNTFTVAPTAPYHLLVYHSLDVAATAYHLLHDDAPIMSDLSGYLEIDKSKLRDLLCFLIGLHDLGKFAASFQGLYQENDDFLVVVDREAYPYKKRHDALGWCFYQNALFNEAFCHQNSLDDIEFGLDILFNCVLGHHGKPINTYDDPVDFDDLSIVGVDYNREIDPKNLQAANEWITDLQALFNVDMPVDLLADSEWQTRVKHISWQLSGIMSYAEETVEINLVN